MCLSIPGKVVKVDKESVDVDYGATKVKAKTLVIKPKLGDYVLVQGKHVTHIFKPEKAKEILAAFDEVLSS